MCYARGQHVLQCRSLLNDSNQDMSAQALKTEEVARTFWMCREIALIDLHSSRTLASWNSVPQIHKHREPRRLRVCGTLRAYSAQYTSRNLDEKSHETWTKKGHVSQKRGSRGANFHNLGLNSTCTCNTRPNIKDLFVVSRRDRGLNFILKLGLWRPVGTPQGQDPPCVRYRSRFPNRILAYVKLKIRKNGISSTRAGAA
jgi:hypothetical protein